MNFPLIQAFNVNKISKTQTSYSKGVLQYANDEFVKSSSVPNNLPQINFVPNPVSFSGGKINLQKKEIISKHNLLQEAIRLNKEYKSQIGKIEETTKKYFEDLEGNNIITAREKSVKSIFSKLKDCKGKISPLNFVKDCHDIITDGLGTRIQLKPVPQATAKEIIEFCEIDYNDFVSTVKGSIETGEKLPELYQIAIESLKTEQTKSFLNKLIKNAKNPDFKINLIENYGDELSSYFTYDQIKSIAYASGNPDLGMVTKLEPDNNRINTTIKIDEETGKTFETSEIYDENGELAGKITDDGAVKKSGYATCQMNIEYNLENNIKASGELQIRGTLLNDFAEAEHIPYDIRQGKITEKDTEFADIYNLIKSLDDSSYKKYNQYLTRLYKTFRMQELGLEIKLPELKGAYINKNGLQIDEKSLEKLSYKSLIEYKKKHDILEKRKWPSEK